MMAIAGLVATSCQDNLAPVANEGELASVSLQVETPEIATRTYSDGMSATVLQYAVYDEAGNEISDLTVTDAVINGKTTVELKLTTGNTYSMIFWAAAPEAPYTVDLTDKTMSVDYTAAVSNDENRDAFYKYVEPFTVTGTMSKTVELKRPFAQLNIGTSDYAASEAAGYVPTESYVKVPAYSALNLVTGEVSEQVTVEYDYAAIDRTEAFPVAGYEYIAMNYLLVSADKEVVEVEFAYTDGVAEKTRTVGSVPVQRNHRTNLYGQLLTSDVDINVEILPGYEEDLPETDAEKLAIVAQLGGTVVLSEDVVLSKPLKVEQPMVIDLNGYSITTQLKEEGRHHYAIDNYSVLTLQGEGEINARGVENFGTMTVDGNITITNVDTNGGAAIWNEGDLVINGGTFKTNASAGEGSYGGALNTRSTGKAVVNGGTFEAYSQLTYAIINDGETVINDAVVKGKHGAVSGAESNDKTTINGGSFELMENPAVSDHCLYFVSTVRGGMFTLGTNTDSGAKLFYNSVIAEGCKAVENAGWTYVVEAETDAELLAIVAQLGGTVVLSEDVVLSKALNVAQPMVIDLNGYSITTELKSEGRHHYAIDNYSVLTLQGEGEINARGVENFGTMTINGDITITNVDTNGGSAIWNEGNLTINGGTFTTNTEAGVGSYGGALYTEEGATCVVNGGTFVANSQLTYAVLNYGKTTFNNGTVKGKHGAIGGGIDENGEYYGKTTINGGSFELMENPAVSDHCAYYINDIRGGKFTLGVNTDSGAQLFYDSVIAEGYKTVVDGDWTSVVAE